MINKYGQCPNCKEEWNQGDIKQNISKLSLFGYKSDYEMSKIAGNYGWKEFSKTNFSRVSSIITEDGRELYKCPNIRCGYIFDSETEEEFDCLSDALAKVKEEV